MNGIKKKKKKNHLKQKIKIKHISRRFGVFNDGRWKMSHVHF